MNRTGKLLKSLMLASLLAPIFLTAANEEETNGNTGNRAREEAKCGYIFDRYPVGYNSTSLHWFTGVTINGDSAVLDDGSVWLLNTYDGLKALGWITNDPNYVIPLYVTQNSSWFSNYRYRIVNSNTGESIPANLHLGPLKENPYSVFVSALDPSNRIIILSNGRRFEVSPGDQSGYLKFATYDYVIVGQNGGWSSNYQYILINVNMDHYVHAREF